MSYRSVLKHLISFPELEFFGLTELVLSDHFDVISSGTIEGTIFDYFHNGY